MGRLVQSMKYIAVLLTLIFSTLRAEYTDEEVSLAKKKICDRLPSMYGWCSQEKALAMFQLVLEAKPQVIVEIGVFGGASLFPSAMALKLIGDGVIIGIDPWDRLEAIRYFNQFSEKEHIQWWGRLNMDYIYSSYLHCLKEFDLNPWVETLRMTSEEAVDKVDSIDILHVDGNFAGDMPLKDVVLYLPKVKSGGYIWLNDALKPNREAAIELLLGTCRVVSAVNGQTCILFQKK